MSLRRVIEQDTLRLLDGDQDILSMEEQAEEDRVKITLRGMLRSDTVFDFQDELEGLAILGMSLVLDFSGVTYLSTSCQQALILVQQKLDTAGKGTLLLTGLPQEIYGELEKTGASELLMIDET